MLNVLFCKIMILQQRDCLSPSCLEMSNLRFCWILNILLNDWWTIFPAAILFLSQVTILFFPWTMKSLYTFFQHWKPWHCYFFDIPSFLFTHSDSRHADFVQIFPFIFVRGIVVLASDVVTPELSIGICLVKILWFVLSVYPWLNNPPKT